MITIGLIIALLLTLALLGLALVRIETLHHESMDAAEIDHSKCIAHIAHVTSHQFLADRLRNYAIRWDSVEEQPHLNQLAHDEYRAGGPSMPAIWMNTLADELDGETHAG